MKQIISGTGELLDLVQWQQFRGYKGNKISDNFSWTEFDCDGELLLSEVLIDFLQYVRLKWGKPITINSGYRTKAKQTQLKEQGYKAATFSPHTKGMAGDLETGTPDETKKLAALVLQCAKDIQMPVRIGFNQYLKAGQTFVHVDICPHYFAKGKPYHDQPHPNAWDIPYLTW